MPSFSAEHISEHSCDNLFDIVADIESYPEFLPACKEAEILERHKNHMIARLTVGYGPLLETFISRVFLDRELGVIHVQLEEGPLKNLDCKWSFTQKEEGCQTICMLDFNFQQGMLAWIAAPIMDHAAQRLMDSFIKRAGQAGRGRA